MAAGGASLQDNFKSFASKAEGKEQTTADFTKWCKDANVFGKTCNSNHVDIAFAKVKPTASKTITFNELDALITEMAKKYKDDLKIDEAKAKDDIKDKLMKATPKAHGVTMSNVTAADLRAAADRYHVDHVIEWQLISAAISNVTFDYKKNWHVRVVKFFGDMPNLTIRSVNDNNRKKAAVTRFINGTATPDDDGYIDEIIEHWEKIRDELKNLEKFKIELDRVLGLED
jgi:hypothetical protein